MKKAEQVAEVMLFPMLVSNGTGNSPVPVTTVPSSVLFCVDVGAALEVVPVGLAVLIELETEADVFDDVAWLVPMDVVDDNVLVDCPKAPVLNNNTDSTKKSIRRRTVLLRCEFECDRGDLLTIRRFPNPAFRSLYPEFLAD